MNILQNLLWRAAMGGAPVRMFYEQAQAEQGDRNGKGYC